jgi:hypothetical protein
MAICPGDALTTEFSCQRIDTGFYSNADGTPVATASRNGVDDAAFILTVTNKETGLYKITGTVPLDYDAGDMVAIRVLATVNSVSGKEVVDQFVIDSHRNSSLYVLLDRLLGLTQDNWVLDDTTYDGSDNLTAASVYVYEAAADLATHVSGGGPNLKYQWNFAGTMTGANLTQAQQERVL